MGRTNYFISETGSDSTGSGTKSAPWATVTKALATIIQDTSNGDQINIKGAIEQTALLDFSRFSISNTGNAITFRGYNVDENDGGVGVIDGKGTTEKLIDYRTNCDFLDLKITNFNNSGETLRVEFSFFNNVEFENINRVALSNGVFRNCNFGLIKGSNSLRLSSGSVQDSYFNNSYDYSSLISMNGYGSEVRNCILNVANDKRGIYVNYNFYSSITNNSFLGNGGNNSRGVNVEEATFPIYNNIFENLNNGIRTNNNSRVMPILGYNSFFNCVDNINGDIKHAYDQSDNETLASSPFTKLGADNFLNRKEYFMPQDVGGIKNGLNNITRGAINKCFSAGLINNSPNIHVTKF